MLKAIKKGKWIIHWLTLTLLVSSFIMFSIVFENKTWLGNALQTIGTITGFYLTIIIFLSSKEGADKQYREHLEHLQKLNNDHIIALSNSTSKQIEAIQELTNKQIEVLHETTEKQIVALKKSTDEQISSFEKQTSDVTNKLGDNSVLLAEILGRELEKAINVSQKAVNQEQSKYNDLSGWKFLRSKESKQKQLASQFYRINLRRNGHNYLLTKYNHVKKFIGFEQKTLK